METNQHTSVEEDLDFALMLVGIGERIAVSRFGSAPGGEDGARLSMGAADRAIESTLARIVAEWRPDEGLLGEEFGLAHADRQRRWIIDPINGSESFAAGGDRWGVMVALEDAGVIQAAVMAAPQRGTWWYAGRGLGAFRNGERITVESSRSSLRISQRAATLRDSDSLNPSIASQLESAEVVPDSEFWPETLIAQGDLDVDASTSGRVWSMAPWSLLVEEAGGSFTDLNGNHRADAGHSLASASPELHRHLLCEEAVTPGPDMVAPINAPSVAFG